MRRILSNKSQERVEFRKKKERKKGEKRSYFEMWQAGLERTGYGFLESYNRI